MKKVKYRFNKTFTASYAGYDRVQCEASYDMYVRDLKMGVQTDINPLEKLFVKAMRVYDFAGFKYGWWI